MSRFREFMDRLRQSQSVTEQVQVQNQVYDAAQFAAGNIEDPAVFTELTKKIYSLLRDLDKNPYTRNKSKAIRSTLKSIKVEIPPQPTLDAGWLEKTRAAWSGVELPQQIEYRRKLSERGEKIAAMQRHYSKALILLEEANVLGSLILKNEGANRPIVHQIEMNHMSLLVPFIRIENSDLNGVTYTEQQYIPVIPNSDAVDIMTRLRALREILTERMQSNIEISEEIIATVVPQLFVEFIDLSDRIGDAQIRVIYKGPQILHPDGTVAIRSHQDLLKLNLNYSTPGILRYTIQTVGGGEIEQVTIGEDMDLKLFAEAISKSLTEQTNGLLAVNPEVFEEALDIAKKQAQGERLIKELQVLYEKFQENRDIKIGLTTEAGRTALIKYIESYMPWLVGTQVLEDIETILSLGIIQTASQWLFFLRAMQQQNANGLEEMMKKVINPPSPQRLQVGESQANTALTVTGSSRDQVKDFMLDLVGRVKGGYINNDDNIVIGVVTQELISLGLVPSSYNVGDPLPFGILKSLLNKQSLKEIFKPENITFFEEYVKEMRGILMKIAKQTKNNQLLVARGYKQAHEEAGQDLERNKQIMIQRMKRRVSENHRRMVGPLTDDPTSLDDEVIEGEFEN